MKKANYFIFTIAISICLSSFAENKIPDGTFQELRNFKSSDNLSLPEDYVKTFPQIILSLMEASETNFLKKYESDCKDSIDIQYIDRITKNQNKVAEEFESNMIKIDVSKCFRNTTAQKLIDITTNTEFLKKAIPSLIESNFANGRYCEKTSTPIIGKSSYCSQLDVDLTNDRYIKALNFNDWNDANSKFNLKIYFRSGYVTSRQINNDAVYHLVTYIRGPSLSTFERFFVKDFIAQAQQNTFKLVEQELVK